LKCLPALVFLPVPGLEWREGKGGDEDADYTDRL
jgi:hypothetical protein